MRFHPRRIALASAFLLVMAPACSSGDGSKSADPSAATSTAPPTTHAATRGVVLEEAGAQPRIALELRLAPGARSQVAMESRIAIEMTVDGKAVPAGVLPATSIVLDEVVDAVDPDGTVHYTATFRDVRALDTPGVDPEVLTQTQAGLAEMEGLAGKGTFDVHGGSQTITIDSSALTNGALKSTLDSMASQVGNLTAPFPREPVGVGARWTTTATATINGITMNTTTHYTLSSRTGDRYELDYVQEATAPPGPAPFPNLPAGTRAAVKEFTVHSTGHTTGDLTRHLPSSSRGSGTGDGTFTITVGADGADLVEHMTIDLRLSTP